MPDGENIPPAQDRIDRESLVLWDGDEPPRVDKSIYLRLIEMAGGGVHLHSTARPEEVGGVMVQLGALMGGKGVLDGKFVQSELSCQVVEFPLLGVQTSTHTTVSDCSRYSETSAIGKPSASRIPLR